MDVRFDKDKAAFDFLHNIMRHILFIPYDYKKYKFILKPEDYCMYRGGDIMWHSFDLACSKVRGLVGSSDDEKHQRKEWIPKRTLNNFDRLIAEAGIDKEKQKQYKEEVRAFGIQGIVGLANEFVADSPIHQYIKELKVTYKHADMRFGREVIFTEEELMERVSVNYE